MSIVVVVSSFLCYNILWINVTHKKNRCNANYNG